MADKTYDLIIIGAGPAGLTSAIYAARYNLNAVIISKDIGGAIVDAHTIENYPGFKSISGEGLIKNFREQVEALGVKIIQEEVKGISKTDGEFVVNNKYNAKKIILALGTEKRKMNLEKEEDFIGRGVSYCATCDAAFYKGKTVGVIGGNDSAARASQLLLQFADKVYVIYRKSKIRAQPALVEELEKEKKIEFAYNSNVTKLLGDKVLKGVKLDDNSELKLDGLFIEVGSVPSTALALELGVKVNEEGYIVVDSGQKTNIDGVYSAGDITESCNNLKQVITACAEGAVAAESAYVELKKKKGEHKVA